MIKKLKFFHLLCLSKIDREKVFTDVLDKKKRLLKTLRTTVYEKRKISIFPKGLVHRFGQKFEISSTLIFMQNRPKKVSGNVLIKNKISIIFCNPCKPEFCRSLQETTHNISTFNTGEKSSNYSRKLSLSPHNASHGNFSPLKQSIYPRSRM